MGAATNVIYLIKLKFVVISDIFSSLPGFPLAHSVVVGVGSMAMWPWTARNTRFELAWVSISTYASVYK